MCFLWGFLSKPAFMPAFFISEVPFRLFRKSLIEPFPRKVVIYNTFHNGKDLFMKKLLVYLIPLLLLLPAFGLRDYHQNNELRYISIADEALSDGTWFTFHNDGIPYADKPPLYFWMLMGVKTLTGRHLMWIEALFTLIPAFVILYIMNIWTFRRQRLTDILPPMLTLLTTGMFIGSTMILRMDMMMAMFIILSLYIFHRMYEGRGTKADSYLMPLCIFLAVFSKGPVGIIVPFLSIFIFLLFERKIKTLFRYLGWRTWIVLLPLFGIWFLRVYREGGTAYIDNLLFDQTVKRGIAATHHKEPFWFYFARIWMVGAPWVIFCAVIMVKAFHRKLMDSDSTLRLFGVVIISTLIMLSCASGKLDIYLLPAYPFMVYFAFRVLYEIKPDTWVKAAVALPAIALLMAYPALFILTEHTPVIPKNTFFLYFGAMILTAGGAYALWAVFKGNLRHAFPAVGGSILAFIFIGSFYIPQFNDYMGLRNLSHRTEEVARKEQISNLAFYKFRGGENMTVFMPQKMKRIATTTQLYQLGLDSVPTLLLIRVRDVEKNPVISSFLNQRPVLEVGNYRGYVVPNSFAPGKKEVQPVACSPKYFY